MAQQGIDFSEMDEFTKRLMDIAVKKMPKESKKFLRTEGNKLKKIIKKNAKSSGVKKQSGNYIKSIKRGKIYKYEGKLSIRAYSTDPKAHLIELGHKIVTKKPGKQDVGFVPGHHVFKKSEAEFKSEYLADCKEFFDGLLEDGLS
ncbi:HK97 gp10 family phage protein [Paenibacillus sp. 19GGS1-52]|uniref:HK97 gp10 family phage protein n=1 Tax=Paenibacillus sp. 19GGS1-52 TaxID=2758563 RepID=UPI001EFB2F3D|nr:HK97 gp10 family phage protein [Paenibacillus sp. 19GGS1-52]ULO09667.1 HK97 gp10 family phage protein [Paenibacillus sp. 19GGS1-52]